MIRAAAVEDAEAIARVHVAAWAETYAGIAPPEVLARWTVADRAARWHRILSGDPPDPHRAEVAVLDLGGTVRASPPGASSATTPCARGASAASQRDLPPPRGAGPGHGRALMALRREPPRPRPPGRERLGPARQPPGPRFYERLGGTLCGEAEDSLADLPVAVVGYAWPALDAIGAREMPGVGSSQ
jgi:hypothetical protein